MDKGSPCKIITLISDCGLNDFYIAAVKGAILSKLPSATIVDITHNIPPFNIKKAAFILANSYKCFPEGTIHIVDINTEESEHNSHYAINYDNHYFIGANNGLFSLIFSKKPREIYEINMPQETNFFTFATRDRFVKAAIHIALNNNISELGEKSDYIYTNILLKPQANNNIIKSTVTYIDNYGNVMLNISFDEFKNSFLNKKFKIIIKGREYNDNKIHRAYSDVHIGEIVTLFGSTGLLEIAINNDNAAQLLGIKNDDTIIIEFI